MQIANGHGYETRAGAALAESDRLLEQARGGSRSPEKAKIEKAGKDFESILLGSWLQGAEKSFAATPGDDGEGEDDGDSSNDQFQSMAMQQLAGSLADAGGIGIGRMITAHLEAASANKPASAGENLLKE